MNAPIQDNRPVEVISTLGPNKLLFGQLHGREALGNPFEYHLVLYSENPSIELKDVLGTSMTVRLTLEDGSYRYWNGLVAEFHRGGRTGRYATYFATLRPWIWFLSRAADCKIFQEKSGLDIIQEVLRDSGLGELDNATTGSFRSRVYCVQYRETAFNFVSRLMEEEGIYYFFRHSDGKHTLVLADSSGAHDKVGGYEKVAYIQARGTGYQEIEQFMTWSRSQRVLPTQFSLTDYDFERPKADLLVRSIGKEEHANAGAEVFDFPGHFRATGDGEGYARVRMEEHQAQYQRAHGTSNARGLGSGHLFSLSEHPVAGENVEYLIVDADYELTGNAFESGGGAPVTFSSTLSMLESKTPYRPARKTPMPVVQGPQTAVVVGPSGQEIWTDKYGRVKVKFPWDRYAKGDEKSSCWVRVSHPSAGQNWGAVQIPRIGQEVIVSFLEGNPDEPIITGRVYNADQMPPFELPSKAMISGMKSNSTPGGGGYNEISMDDTKGTEKIVVHGQFDLEQTIEHDEKMLVKNNRERTVGVDETITIGSNKTETIGKELSESVGANMALSVGASKTETVGAMSSLTIGAAYEVTVAAAMVESVGATKTVNVVSHTSEQVGGNKSTMVTGAISTKTTKSYTLDVTQDMKLTSQKKTTMTSMDALTIDGQKKAIITIADELTLKCGKATITLKKSGDILIEGAKINIKGSGDVVVKGSKISEN